MTQIVQNLLQRTSVVFMYNSDGTVAANSTVYLSTGGQQATEANCKYSMPCSGTLKKLTYKASGVPGGADTVTYTVNVNASGSSLTTGAVTTIEGSATVDVDVDEGNDISIEVVTSATAAAKHHNVLVLVELYPDTMT